MAELDADTLISKISDIDTQIATITAAISSTGGAHLVDYEINNKKVSASQKLDELLKVREVYQTLLEKIPSTIIRNAQYERQRMTGNDFSEFIGDE